MNNCGFFGNMPGIKPIGKNFAKNIKKALFFIFGITNLFICWAMLRFSMQYFAEGSWVIQIVYFVGLIVPMYLIIDDSDNKKCMRSIFFGLGGILGFFIVARFLSGQMITAHIAAMKTLAAIMLYIILGTSVYFVRRVVK